MKRLILLQALGMTAYSQSYAETCSKAFLNKAIYQSQTLDQGAEASLSKLAKCENVALREQAVYWGGFFFALKKQEQKTVNLIDSAFPYSKQNSESEKIFYKARRGEWGPLKNKIDSGDSKYLTSLDARIILAHSLMFAHKFDEALKVYQEYLALKPDDDLVDAEYLFALIWAGNLEVARARVLKLKSFPLGSYLKKSATHAEQVINEISPALEPDSSKKVLSGRLKATIEQSDETSVASRQSIGVAYQGAFGVGIRSHQLESELDSTKQDLLEFQGNLNLSQDDYQFQLALGYYSGGTGHVTGSMALKLQFDDIYIKGGASRTPLTLLEAQPIASDDILTSSLFMELAIGHWVTYYSSISQDDTLAPHEFHNLTLSVPIFFKSTGKGLFLQAPISYRSHPKASPFYKTNPVELSTMGGILYNMPISRVSYLKASAYMGARYRNSRLDEDSYQTLAAFEASFDLEHRFNDEWYGHLVVKTENTAKEEFENEAESKLSILAGLSYGSESL